MGAMISAGGCCKLLARAGTIDATVESSAYCGSLSGLYIVCFAASNGIINQLKYDILILILLLVKAGGVTRDETSGEHLCGFYSYSSMWCLSQGDTIKKENNEMIDGEYYKNNLPIGDLINRKNDKKIDEKYYKNISPIGDAIKKGNNEIIDEEYYENNLPIGDLINRENETLLGTPTGTLTGASTASQTPSNTNYTHVFNE